MFATLGGLGCMPKIALVYILNLSKEQASKVAIFAESFNFPKIQAALLMCTERS